MSNTDALLPSSWLKTNLGSVLQYGKVEKADPSEIHSDTWVLELEDIEKDNSKIIQRLTFLERQSKSTKNRFKEGDVLYGKLRPYLNKVVIADSDGVCTTEVIPLSSNGLLSNKYLFYWLKHPSFLAYVTQVGYGVNMPRLGTKDGIAAPFILAPLAEQHKIAAKLDELLAQVDSIKTRLDAIPNILKRFRQSVLAAAVSGKLTEDWRSPEIKKIDWEGIQNKRLSLYNTNDEYKLQWRKKLPDNLGFVATNFEEWCELPALWSWVSIYSISTIDKFSIVDGPFGSDLKSIDYVDDGDVPVLTISIMYNIDDLSPARLISMEKFKTIIRSKVIGGDILLAKIGSTYGISCLYPEKNPTAMIPANMCKITVDREHFNRDYVQLWLQSTVFKSYLDKIVSFSAQPAFNVGNFKKLPIPLPPLSEQSEIVRRVEKLFSYADQIEQRVRDAQARVNQLTQAILAKAFRGELTADWRAQNPDLISGENSAEALLLKIQAERSNSIKGKSSQRRRSA